MGIGLKVEVVEGGGVIKRTQIKLLINLKRKMVENSQCCRNRVRGLLERELVVAKRNRGTVNLRSEIQRERVG